MPPALLSLAGPPALLIGPEPGKGEGRAKGRAGGLGPWVVAGAGLGPGLGRVKAGTQSCLSVRLASLYWELFLICALVTALESLYASAIACASAGVQRLCYGCGLISKGLGI